VTGIKKEEKWVTFIGTLLAQSQQVAPATTRRAAFNENRGLNLTSSPTLFLENPSTGTGMGTPR